jgi:2-C-methyl-D-erythritol 4-phosphate cytidylyltransferase
MRCLDATPSVRGLIVVAPPDSIKRVSRLLARFRIKKVLATVPGGKERQGSVWLGLQAVPHEAEIVLVHDAVRPCVTRRLVDSVIREAERFGAATCGLPARETVKRIKDGWVEETLSREGLWLTQTPQAFHRSLLWKSHDKARGDGFWGTDDAMLVQRLGVNVRMVLGLQENIKITTREDLTFAQRLLRKRG